MAHEARVLPDGSLSLVQMRAGEPPRVNLVIAPGYWITCYAASMVNGAPVAVEKWKGEVDRNAK